MESAEQQTPSPSPEAAERTDADREATTEDFEQDPARNPESDELEDVKGG